MIGWTKLVGTTAWVMSASLIACAGATARPSTPNYYRSPRLDYADAPRSASDGQVLGAHQQASGEWLQAGATSEHPAPGWRSEYGQLRFNHEHVKGGNGVFLEQPVCDPPPEKPRAPDAVRAEASQSAWLEGAPAPARLSFAGAVAEVPAQRSELLSCARR